MDGVSAASSVIAVVSVSAQLIKGIKELYNFWKSIEEAPENVRNIVENLTFLSHVLDDIDFKVEQNASVKALLEACVLTVKRLKTLNEFFERGFASKKRVIRKWTALKSVFNAERVRRFQEILSELKITLLLAQNNHLL